jgi:peroxiredoxin
LTNLGRDASFIPYTTLEPTLRPLFEQNRDSKVRSLVLMSLAHSLMRADDPETNRRAIALLQEIGEKHADEDVAHEAHDLLAALTAVMPGATAPDFFLNDSARLPFRLSDYRGRVVVLFFSTLQDEEANKSIPARLELMKSLENRPFSMVGIDFDSPAIETFQQRATKFGVAWRTALVFTPKDDLVQAYKVRTPLAWFVIDADGVIRSRNAPWDETVKLVEKLVAETEAKLPKKG